MAMVRATTSFIWYGDKDNPRLSVSEGSAHDDKSAVVKACPDLFSADTPAAASARQDVEQATAAPGEKRATKPKAKK